MRAAGGAGVRIARFLFNRALEVQYATAIVWMLETVMARSESLPPRHAPQLSKCERACISATITRPNSLHARNDSVPRVQGEASCVTSRSRPVTRALGS